MNTFDVRVHTIRRRKHRRLHLARHATAPDGRLFRGARGGMLSESLYGRVWHAARARNSVRVLHAAYTHCVNDRGDVANQQIEHALRVRNHPSHRASKRSGEPPPPAHSCPLYVRNQPTGSPPATTRHAPSAGHHDPADAIQRQPAQTG